jgi:DNA-binding transcriptional regulator YiaG
MKTPPKPKRKWTKLTTTQGARFKTKRAKWRQENPSIQMLDCAATVKACREQMSMSQAEFAKQVGVTKQTVSRWERASGHMPGPGPVRRKLVRLIELNVPHLAASTTSPNES